MKRSPLKRNPAAIRDWENRSRQKKAPQEIVETQCQHCGVTFRPRTMSVPRKFCSRPCFFADLRAERVSRICEACGKSFEVPTFRLGETRGLYCSITCSNKHFKRKPRPRVSRLVGAGAVNRRLQKDVEVTGLCESCGKLPARIRWKRDRDPLNDKPSNIDLLCPPCATRRIGRKNRAYPDYPGPQEWREATIGRVCLNCGSGDKIAGHHAITQQTLRHNAAARSNKPFPMVRWDLRNLVPLCASCHAYHHHRSRVVLFEKLPESCMDFAQELGPWAVEALLRAHPRETC